MNRIQNIFARCRAEKKGAFVAYLTMGAPTLAASEAAVDDLVAGGVDILELGVPFSDPFADGAVIRSAAYTALAQGVTIDDVLAAAKRLRARHPETGLVVFTYYNLIFSKGVETFAAEAAAAGVDAVLVVDLPLEERDELLGALRAHGLTFVPLIAPNTPLDRVVESAEGLDDSFLYVITVKGVTGARAELPPDLTAHLDAIRDAVKTPIVAGFGISTQAQADVVSQHADGFVVGSALVKRLNAEGSLKGPLLP